MTWRTIDGERLSLANLFGSLSADEWETESLCTGWRVRDVAAHLTLAHMGMFPVVLEMLRARGNLNRMIRDTAVRQARLPTGQYAVLLRGMIGSRRTAPGITELEPLIDVLVHGQDIAISLGRTRPMPPAAAATAATRVWTMGRPFPAERKLSGFRLVATDHPGRPGRAGRSRDLSRRSCCCSPPGGPPCRNCPVPGPLSCRRGCRSSQA